MDALEDQLTSSLSLAFGSLISAMKLEFSKIDAQFETMSERLDILERQIEQVQAQHLAYPDTPEPSGIASPKISSSAPPKNKKVKKKKKKKKKRRKKKKRDDEATESEQLDISSRTAATSETEKAGNMGTVVRSAQKDLVGQSLIVQRKGSKKKKEKKKNTKQLARIASEPNSPAIPAGHQNDTHADTPVRFESHAHSFMFKRPRRKKKNKKKTKKGNKKQKKKGMRALLSQSQEGREFEVQYRSDEEDRNPSTEERLMEEYSKQMEQHASPKSPPEDPDRIDVRPAVEEEGDKIGTEPPETPQSEADTIGRAPHVLVVSEDDDDTDDPEEEDFDVKDVDYLRKVATANAFKVHMAAQEENHQKLEHRDHDEDQEDDSTNHEEEEEEEEEEDEGQHKDAEGEENDKDDELNPNYKDVIVGIQREGTEEEQTEEMSYDTEEAAAAGFPPSLEFLEEDQPSVADLSDRIIEYENNNKRISCITIGHESTPFDPCFVQFIAEELTYSLEPKYLKCLRFDTLKLTDSTLYNALSMLVKHCPNLTELTFHVRVRIASKVNVFRLTSSGYDVLVNVFDPLQTMIDRLKAESPAAIRSSTGKPMVLWYNTGGTLLQPVQDLEKQSMASIGFRADMFSVFGCIFTITHTTPSSTLFVVKLSVGVWVFDDIMWNKDTTKQLSSQLKKKSRVFAGNSEVKRFMFRGAILTEGKTLKVHKLGPKLGNVLYGS